MTRLRTAVRAACAGVLALALPLQSLAWGREGHRLIALVAQSRLSPVAMREVAALLGSETLADASTWPDEIRKDHPETAGWHYVSIPRSAAFFDEERDCFKPDAAHPDAAANTDHHNCVVDRIDLFARTLADRSQSQSARVDALKYLVHFVGDLHQPMHAMDEARGGNDIHVVQFGSNTCGLEGHSCNLHGLWDSGLIEHAGMDEQRYFRYLREAIGREEIASMPVGTPADWANESHRAAEGALLPEGGLADQLYFYQEISVVEARLALAGVRLGRLLNLLLASDKTEAQR